MSAENFDTLVNTSGKKVKPGMVYGPLLEENSASLFKLQRILQVPDSAMVRGIWVAHKGGLRVDPSVTRKRAEALRRADSIRDVIRSGESKMEDLVEKLTDDPGSKAGNKGCYGWFTPESGFIPAYILAAYENAVGETVVIDSEFGYYVVQVLAKSSHCSPYYVLLKLTQPIDPAQPCTETPGAFLYFNGGQAGFDAWCRNAIRYPEQEKKEKQEVVIWVEISVNDAGQIVSVYAINAVSGHPAFATEACRVVAASRGWNPKHYNGKFYGHTEAVPVVFLLKS